jgi:uncharacterized protein
MSISMYQASIPVFIRMLNNLNGILQKAAVWAEAKKVDPMVLLNSRLYPDMFPLVRQVQIAADTAKGAAARLAGLEPPNYEDNETSFAQLAARIDKTITYLESFGPGQIDGSEERTIMVTSHGEELRYEGMVFLLNSRLPNFYFHVTTAYAILRHSGVDIGKKDYLGKLD